MTYNEWRDELKSNLLCVSESERRRVLDYYAEAYADRRDAGYSEREIIQDFGAPYDAAQRILSENTYGYYEEQPADYSARDERRNERREERERRREERRDEKERIRNNYQNCNAGSQSGYGYAGHNGNGQQYTPPPPQPQYTPQPQYAVQPEPVKKRGDYTWVFVLLCILFAIPIAIVVLGMVIVTVVFCVAPFGILITGVATAGAGVGMLFVEPSAAFVSIGAGLMIFGLSLIVMPLCFQLVKWMWKLFHMFFAWLKRLFSGKEKVR